MEMEDDLDLAAIVLDIYRKIFEKRFKTEITKHAPGYTLQCRILTLCIVHLEFTQEEVRICLPGIWNSEGYGNQYVSPERALVIPYADPKMWEKVIIHTFPIIRQTIERYHDLRSDIHREEYGIEIGWDGQSRSIVRRKEI